MNAFLMLGLLALPVTGLAQSNLSPAFPQGFANPHGYFLSSKVLLYRQLRDTATGNFARRLHSGNTVVLLTHKFPLYPRWIKVVRGNAKGTNFSRDTTAYYIRWSDIEGSRNFILI